MEIKFVMRNDTEVKLSGKEYESYAAFRNKINLKEEKEFQKRLKLRQKESGRPQPLMIRRSTSPEEVFVSWLKQTTSPKHVWLLQHNAKILENVLAFSSFEAAMAFGKKKKYDDWEVERKELRDETN